MNKHSEQYLSGRTTPTLLCEQYKTVHRATRGMYISEEKIHLFTQTIPQLSRFVLYELQAVACNTLSKMRAWAISSRVLQPRSGWMSYKIAHMLQQRASELHSSAISDSMALLDTAYEFIKRVGEANTLVALDTARDIEIKVQRGICTSCALTLRSLFPLNCLWNIFIELPMATITMLWNLFLSLQVNKRCYVAHETVINWRGSFDVCLLWS